VGALAIALALSSCGSSAGGNASTGSGAAAIVSFVVPKVVACGPAPNTQVVVSYAVDSARNQHVVVDGRVQKGTEAASRSFALPLPCDNRKHTIALVVEGARGHLLGRVKYVTTIRKAG